MRQQAKHDAKDSNHQHEFPALISMTGAERDALQRNPAGAGPGDGGELALQIAAEDEFFTEAGSKRQHQVKNDFNGTVRKHIADRLIGSGFQQVAHCVEDDQRDNQKSDRDGEIAKCLNGACPTPADQIADANATAAHAVPDEGYREPLHHHDENVAGGASMGGHKG